jgi:hypothetical protein
MKDGYNKTQISPFLHFDNSLKKQQNASLRIGHGTPDFSLFISSVG